MKTQNQVASFSPFSFSLNSFSFFFPLLFIRTFSFGLGYDNNGREVLGEKQFGDAFSVLWDVLESESSYSTYERRSMTFLNKS